MINIIIIMVITMVIIIASSVFQELTALYMSFLFQRDAVAGKGFILR